MDAAVERLDARAVRQILLQPRSLPRIGPQAANDLNEAFKAGVVNMMLRQGGWNQEKRPSDREPTRLWERYPEYELHFSPYSQSLLTALCEQRLLDPDQQLPHQASLGLGDQVSLFLVARLLTRAGLHEALQLHECFGSSALCRLGFPQFIDTDELDLREWSNPNGLCTLEGLQGPLAECLLRAERFKMRSTLDQVMIRIGASQHVSATALLDLFDSNERLDLGELYLVILETLLAEHSSGADWLTLLGEVRSVQERSRAVQAAASTLRLTERFAERYRLAQATSFFDDDYSQQQTLLSRWEQRLPSLLIGAEHRLLELDPLTVVARTSRN